jgi:hypothetical protein
MSKLLAAFAVLLLAQVAFAGYDQWVDLRIENKRQEAIHVTGSLSWGKWYANGDKSKEVPAPDFVLQPGQIARIAATGRSDSPSGTEGTVYIRSESSKKQLVETYFNVPYIGKNNFKPIVKDLEATSIVHSNWETSGPLGEMFIKIYQH